MSTTVAPIQSTQVGNYQEDLATLMMRVLTGRAEILDENVRAQASQIAEKNALLKEANVFLAEARIKQSDAGDGTSTMSTEMKAFFDSNNIKYDTTGNDDKHNKDEWGINIENMQTFIDSLTSTSQMDLIDLQSTMDKYGETFDLLTNFLSKYAGKIDAIQGNIR